MSSTTGGLENNPHTHQSPPPSDAVGSHRLDEELLAALSGQDGDGNSDASLPALWRLMAQSLLRNHTALETIASIMGGDDNGGANPEREAEVHAEDEAASHSTVMAGLVTLLGAAEDPERRAGLEAACRCAYQLEHLTATVQRGWTLASRKERGQFRFTDAERIEIAGVGGRLEELFYWTIQVMRLCFSHIPGRQTLDAAHIAKREAGIAGRLLEGALSKEWRNQSDGGARSVLDTAAFLDYMTTISHAMEHLTVLLELIDDGMIEMCARDGERETSNRRRISRTSIRRRSAVLAPRPESDTTTTLTREYLAISEYIQPELVFLNLECTDKEDLLRRLVDEAEKTPNYAAQTSEVRALIRPMLLQREGYGSTSIGHGILFPHARVPGFRGILLILATCRKPIDTPTPDDEPVFMTCLAVVPAEKPSLALKLVSSLSRIFINPEARTALRTAETPAQVVRYITQHDLPVESVIHVCDVSRPYEWTASPDTPVREIARQLLQFRMPGVPVLDKRGALLGEITLTRLQRFGLPNFFMNLQSVSFVRQFDPFEQYFLKEAQSVATDIMNEDVASLPEDGTLMEAIHALAVRRRALVHVIRDGRAVGYVDSGVVLNRVLSP